MRYLKKQIQQVIEDKKNTIAELIEYQSNLALRLDTDTESNTFMSQADLNMHFREMSKLHTKIEQFNSILHELIILQQMNEVEGE